MCVYIYTYTCTESVKSKLSSKIHKNENKSDISLYQVYLPKSSENIFKYYRLDLYNEIRIGFKQALQMTSKFSASLSNRIPI